MTDRQAGRSFFDKNPIIIYYRIYVLNRSDFMSKFVLESEYKPRGDQPQAIRGLVDSINRANKHQTLLGVTGSGKTFTMANIIEQVQRPALVIAHNKTLAYQLASEFKEFFPNNAVEYFVSYYDYYQPEAYVPQSDTFIEKDSSINDEIDKLRHSATLSLFERRDVIIVASVSCIYGLGDPVDYGSLTVSLRPGMVKDRNEVIGNLVGIQYNRNDYEFERGSFRVKGDTLDIFPAASTENIYRVEFFGDEIDRITEINYLTGEIIGFRKHISVFPASHYATTPEKIDRAVETIEEELEERIKYFVDNNKLLEAQRIEQRTRYDIEMLKEVGFCSGIENYTRHLSQREEGSRPYTLIDYFPDDFISFIDESHVTIPQIRGMYAGDRSRKETLVEYGFRLPSALDNRPLRFDEFQDLQRQLVYISATPGPFEKEHSQDYVEQIIRPTGLLDPIIEVRPSKNQIDDLIGEINKRVEKNERVLITTLTKKMAEDLTKYLQEMDIKVTYMHSDIDTLERMEIIRDLRLGKNDVLVGINLLREGLDLPEVSLIVILDADKEGFLRSETSLIQTAGRAARNSNGKVIMYADTITKSMQNTIDETSRRRSIQEVYNKNHKIKPQTVQKSVRDVIEATVAYKDEDDIASNLDDGQLMSMIDVLEANMLEAAEKLDFEKAADLRDRMNALRKKYQAALKRQLREKNA